MKFARIDMLFLIWVLPVLLGLYLYGWRRRRRILNTFASARALDAITPAGLSSRRRRGAVLVLSASLLAIVAMTGPQYGFHWQKIERRGIDIIIALDCSRSMLASDIQPTRLDRAKREIFDLLNMLEGDRVGLVAFSGTAFLQCPLTIDYQAFNIFLDVLKPGYLPVGGSDLAAAIRTCRNAFDPETTTEKAIILITDGENTGPDDPLQAVQEIQKAGIKLFCIGVGSGDGVPIPARNGGFEKDGSGRIVMSRLDEPLLTRMALATGGSYVRSVAGDMDLDTIYHNQIRAHMNTAALKEGRRQVWADRFQWPLALAVVLLFIHLWIPLAKKNLAAVLLPLVLLAAHAPAEAGPLQKGYQAYQKGDYHQALKQFIDGQLKDPENPEILYNIGNAYYKAGDYAAARDHFTQALPKAPPELKPKILYNLGNTAFRQKQLEEAIKNYEAALQLTPKDNEARDNLEFARKRLQQQKQQQKQNESGQQQAKPQEQQENKNSEAGGQQQKNPDSGRSHQPEPPEARKPPPQYGSEMNSPQQPDKKDREGRQQKQNNGASAGERRDLEKPVDQQAGARMLNRLKDQPGRAMMPDYQKRHVDRDW